jgi:hypothetical protein
MRPLWSLLHILLRCHWCPQGLQIMFASESWKKTLAWLKTCFAVSLCACHVYHNYVLMYPCFEMILAPTMFANIHVYCNSYILMYSYLRWYWDLQCLQANNAGTNSQMLSGVVRSCQMSSDAVRCRQMPSEVVRCHQMLSDVVRTVTGLSPVHQKDHHR